MKKSIKIFVQKAEDNLEGGLSGGFASIKGGFMAFASVTTSCNDSCTNSATYCSGNNGRCTNDVNCDNSVNRISCS